MGRGNPEEGGGVAIYSHKFTTSALSEEHEPNEVICKHQSCGVGFWFWVFHEEEAFFAEDVSRLTKQTTHAAVDCCTPVCRCGGKESRSLQSLRIAASELLTHTLPSQPYVALTYPPCLCQSLRINPLQVIIIIIRVDDKMKMLSLPDLYSKTKKRNA